VPEKMALEEKSEVKPTSKEEIIAAAKRKMATLKSQSFDTKLNLASLTVVNTSGESLENIKIDLSNVKEFFELKNWPSKISIWYPFEELTYEIPIEDLESEILVKITDEKGLLLSRSVKIQKLLEKK